jgi:hypothetical protein
MNLNQDTQPTEQIGIGKRISELWSSRSRVTAFFILAATGLVLNCCCLIIPLWDYSGGR